MKNKTININYFVMFIFILLYSVIKSSYVVYMVFGIIFILEIFYLMRKKYENIISQMIIMIPLMGITSVKSIPLANIYSAIFAIYILCFENKYGHSKRLYIYLLFILLDVLKYLIYFNNINGVLNILSVPVFYLSIYAGVIVFEYIQNNKNKYTFFLDCFIYGTILSILYGFIVRLLSGGLRFAFINSNVLTRNAGASGDPNYLGLYIGISIAILFIQNIKEKNKISNYLIILILMFMGLTTSSRMYYIIIAYLIVIMLGVLLIKVVDKHGLKIFLIIGIIGILTFAFRNVISSNFDYLKYRINNETDISNGRFDLGKEYNNYINSSIMRQCIGIGIPQYNIRSGIGAYAHNLYVELYVTQGITGTFIILMCVCRMFFYNKKGILQLLPCSIVLIGGLGVNFLEVDCFYVLFAILLANLMNWRDKMNEKN